MAGCGRLRSPVFHLITGTVAAKAVSAKGKKYRIRIWPDFSTVKPSRQVRCLDFCPLVDFFTIA
jgi:hypothetical protein